ncbi:MlaD family protein [Actinocorallia sp. A-T 12471]|uniref:MlaD family protein n=1 Tax=Actinocorallia sp. A-T 12471 TaxID=3089813 RepID=UPI0029CCC669|nr:MlaD family protein [Actinocorallia sp. A-T 12471]MDX6741351.1 MlaD family protein [Actinocorallia sp. A-T 12471]
MTEHSLARRAAISAVTVVATALLLFVLITKPYESEGDKFTAEFGSAGQGLGTTSPVKVRGMHVGRVSAIELLPNGRARVTMTMHPGVRVPDTATASLEPESVFGPKFINLLPGEHEVGGPYLAAGTAIGKTSDPRDLNDLLADANQTLAALDPAEMAIIVDALASGLAGQGQNLRETIDSVGVIVGVAHDNRRNAELFLADLARLARIGGAGEDIAAIVAGTNAVIETAAQGDGRLRAFADALSGISGLTAHGLSSHGGDLRDGFHSAERAAGVIDAQLGRLGPGLRTIVNLLPVYKAVAWPKAPGDRRMLAVKVLIPANPCAIILGVCPSDATGKNAKPGKKTGKNSDTKQKGNR